MPETATHALNTGEHHDAAPKKERKKILRLNIDRSTNGTYLIIQRDSAFELLFNKLPVRKLDFGNSCEIEYYNMENIASHYELVGMELAQFLKLAGQNTIKNNGGVYDLYLDDRPNIGLIRLKSNGSEVKVPLSLTSEEKLKDWSAKFIRLHKEVYARFLKPVKIEYVLMEREVI